MRKTNDEALNLIKTFEGCKLTAYLDIVGIPTIGYGCTKGVTQDDVKNKRTITQQEAETMLAKELINFETGVNSLVTVPITDNQFGALVAFSYNVGLGSLQKSTLLRILNSGDMNGAANQLLRWNKAGGKEVSGLTRRREAEKALFLKADASKVAQNQPVLPDGPSEEEILQKLKEAEKNTR